MEIASTTCIFVDVSVACVGTLKNGSVLLMSYGLMDFVALFTCILLGMIVYKLYKI